MTNNLLLGCGQCVDRSLFATFPFVFYWGILFGFWSFWLGLPLVIVSRIRKEPLPLYPHRYLLAALALMILMGLPTGGSGALPVGVVAAVALWRSAQLMFKWKAMEQPPTKLELWSFRIQRIFLLAGLGLIPVAYLRAFLQR